MVEERGSAHFVFCAKTAELRLSGVAITFLQHALSNKVLYCRSGISTPLRRAIYEFLKRWR